MKFTNNIPGDDRTAKPRHQTTGQSLEPSLKPSLALA
jgi:hypothetical protein